MRQVLEVSELTRYLKALIDSDEVLRTLWVRGEISNFKAHTSGHCYFTLKDGSSQIRAVLFAGRARGLRFRPANGMRVLVSGYVSVYERDGSYQLYVQYMEPDGKGALAEAFEQLKAKLAAEGLFAKARKRPLPLLPQRVGLVTSASGAALRDLITVARRRFPNIHLLLSPAQVQGAGAAESLVAALERVAPQVDVVIIGRGGGSLEDLWAFNDEGLARAIAACPVPVVSAVGHETDFTIADFVADVRAATPSNAAELVIPNKAELRFAVNNYQERLEQGLRGLLERDRQRLLGLTQRPAFRRPQDRINQARQRLDDLCSRPALAQPKAKVNEARQRLLALAGRPALAQPQEHIERLALRVVEAKHRLAGAMRLRHGAKATGLAAQAGRLDALSPLKVLARGYAVVQHQDGRVVRRAAELRPGERVKLIVHEGHGYAEIIERGDEGW